MWNRLGGFIVLVLFVVTLFALFKGVVAFCSVIVDGFTVVATGVMGVLAWAVPVLVFVVCFVAGIITLAFGVYIAGRVGYYVIPLVDDIVNYRREVRGEDRVTLASHSLVNLPHAPRLIQERYNLLEERYD
jgi:hypothetical protein